jgi:two-component system response regulator WspF
MRIAIVNDVALAVEAIRRVIESAGEHEVAWVARDGLEAVAACAADTPDLILMDLIMPKLDGVEATRRIMAASPCAIVVVTANVSDNTSKVFEAMGAGALDAVNTPVLKQPGGEAGSKALLAKIETIRRLLGSGRAHGGGRPAQPGSEQAAPAPKLLLLGASAGGPVALARVLAGLPSALSAAVVIVQHVDAQFAGGLADWLTGQSSLQVRLAAEGDHPAPGQALLAGRDQHLAFTGPNRLHYTRQPVECSYRPSVDVLFKSAAAHWPGEILGVLLTGMGRDGAEGLLALRQSGHYTIAQDRASSAVYGMPKAAAELKAASEILPLDRIGPRLTQLLGAPAKSHA